MKILIFFTILIAVAFLAWQNNGIVTTRKSFSNKKLPYSFNGFKIVHISDFHNKNFHGRLTNKIKAENPDIIVITGDLIDRRKTNLKIATEFVKEIVEIAPVYYVSGNHEQLSVHYSELKKELKKLNVIIMDNSYKTIYKDDSEIGLTGVPDPTIRKNNEGYLYKNNGIYIRRDLEELTRCSKTDFNILLSHRPEHISIYKEFNFDLVFCGHAHGGQIRIPFIGGILAPDQGFFPKYSEGMCSEGSTTMVVSRGLGNSAFPFRIFNRPELVVVYLIHE